jgi:ATP-binding cassette subfamily F protein uup
VKALPVASFKFISNVQQNMSAAKMPAASRPKSGRMRAQFLEKRMTLLKFSDVSLAFGAMPLLDKVSWQIARGKRRPEAR